MNTIIEETAVLGGGCFWCLEAIYREIQGIQYVESGYAAAAGSQLKRPTYNQVSKGNTGYIEVVKLLYNSTLISFQEILEVFFMIHDPTQFNKQDNDIGTQYKSVIYYTSFLQKKIAKDIIFQIAKKSVLPIVTELNLLSTYYKAEDEQQNYFQRYPFRNYCIYVITPKLVKLKKFLIQKT